MNSRIWVIAYQCGCNAWFMEGISSRQVLLFVLASLHSMCIDSVLDILSVIIRRHSQIESLQ